VALVAFEFLAPKANAGLNNTKNFQNMRTILWHKPLPYLVTKGWKWVNGEKRLSSANPGELLENESVVVDHIVNCYICKGFSDNDLYWWDGDDSYMWLRTCDSLKTFWEELELVESWQDLSYLMAETGFVWE